MRAGGGRVRPRTPPPPVSPVVPTSGRPFWCPRGPSLGRLWGRSCPRCELRNQAQTCSPLQRVSALVHGDGSALRLCEGPAACRNNALGYATPWAKGSRTLSHPACRVALGWRHILEDARKTHVVKTCRWGAAEGEHENTVQKGVRQLSRRKPRPGRDDVWSGGGRPRALEAVPRPRLSCQTAGAWPHRGLCSRRGLEGAPPMVRARRRDTRRPGLVGSATGGGAAVRWPVGARLSRVGAGPEDGGGWRGARAGCPLHPGCSAFGGAPSCGRAQGVRACRAKLDVRSLCEERVASHPMRDGLRRTVYVVARSRGDRFRWASDRSARHQSVSAARCG